jgi:hypothetical protein
VSYDDERATQEIRSLLEGAGERISELEDVLDAAIGRIARLEEALNTHEQAVPHADHQ